MERTVGTITPKKVFSCRGLLFGGSGPESGVTSGDEPPHVTAFTVRPHIPEVISGVCSFDMAADLSPGKEQHEVFKIKLLVVTQFIF